MFGLYFLIFVSLYVGQRMCQGRKDENLVTKRQFIVIFSDKKAVFENLILLYVSESLEKFYLY